MTWTYDDASKMGDIVVHLHYAFAELSLTAYSLPWRTQSEVGPGRR